jgi:hypothetical protein
LIFTGADPAFAARTSKAMQTIVGDLETTIADLVERKNAEPLESPARRFLERQLAGLRYSYEEAGGMIEDLDPLYWGSSAIRP